MNKGTMVEFKPEPPTNPELWNMAGLILGEYEGGLLVGIPGFDSESGNPKTSVYSAKEDQLLVLFHCPPPKAPTLWNRIFWGHLLDEDGELSKEQIEAREMALTKKA